MADVAPLVDPFVLLVVVVVTALIFDYINGFHDTANAIATVVSTNVLSPRTAVMLAAVFNFGGAFLGTGVAKTIGGDIADPVSITQTVVVCALLAGITWNLVTWALGLPSSSSHTLVGGLVGAVACHRVMDENANFWDAFMALMNSKGVHKVTMGLILSPIAGFFIGFLICADASVFLTGIVTVWRCIDLNLFQDTFRISNGHAQGILHFFQSQFAYGLCSIYFMYLDPSF